MSDEIKEKDSYEVVFPERFWDSLKQNEQNVAKLAETMNATFDEVKKAWLVKPDEKSKEDKAELKESITGSLKKAGNQVIPVATGGFAAIVLSEIVDGVWARQNKMVRGGIKFAAAAAVYAWGKKIPFMGETGKNLMAGLLIFDALRDVTPISTWASQVANTVSGVIPVGGLGDQKGRDVVNQAERVATNYYSRALGR